MKLVTIDTGPRGMPGAWLPNDEILHLARAAQPGTAEAWIPHSLRDLLEAGGEGMAITRRLVERVCSAAPHILDTLRTVGALTPAAQTRLLAPITEPRLIVGAGLNYHSHLKEMAGTPPPPRPTGFPKVAASVIGPNAAIRLPAQAPNMVDWEGELACVIGSVCHGVSEAEAMAHIAGYTIINDISARDWVGEVFHSITPWEARLSWEVNIMGKQFPGFTAMGPVIATIDEVGDPNKLTLETRLNGTIVQRAPTSDVIFGFAESIAFFSRWYALQPGDLVTTGTPAGVGAVRKPPLFMKSGDNVEVEVSGIGILRNTIAAPSPPC
jgi:acylpyruvate hydrolase